MHLICCFKHAPSHDMRRVPYVSTKKSSLTPQLIFFHLYRQKHKMLQMLRHLNQHRKKHTSRDALQTSRETLNRILLKTISIQNPLKKLKPEKKKILLKVSEYEVECDKLTNDEAPKKCYLVLCPNEIIQEIAKYLRMREIHALLVSSRELHLALRSELYNQAPRFIHCSGASVIEWAAKRGYVTVIQEFRTPRRRNAISIDKKDRALGLAAETGNLCCIPPLLDMGAEISSSTYCHFTSEAEALTPLHHAARNNFPAIVEYLLAKDVGIAIETSRHMTALDYAVKYGNEECARILIERGIRVDLNKCLNFAATAGHLNILQLLLEKGADFNTQDSTGATPLSLSVTRDHEECVKLLLENGANIEPEVNLLEAAKLDNPAILRLLLAQGVDVNTKDSTSATALEIAVRNGREDFVHILVESGANPKPAKYMSYAINSGRTSVVRLFLERGADPSATSNDRTMCQEAIFSNQADILEMLLDNGADIEGRNRVGQTALHRAAFFGDPRSATILLEKGASVSAQDDRGRRPLHIAGNEKRLIRLFLENGAQVLDTDNDGYTALEYARRRKARNILKKEQKKARKAKQRKG